MNRFRHGLVIGKFYPPHLGHHHLIDTAATQCDRLTVLVLASAAETVPVADRVRWLRTVHDLPKVTVVGGPCDIPMDLGSETVWAAQVAVMKGLVPEPVDAVFSSEGYGEELARRFDAVHVPVDPARSAYPVSGTAVRADVAGSWDLLHPVVRGGLATRVVVLGSESTGTTTVSRALAAHYRSRGGVWTRTGWVPEHGRDYTYELHDEACAKAAAEGRPAPAVSGLRWAPEDFAVIARRQTALEDSAAGKGSPLLVCDTDALATRVWERRYVGPSSSAARDALPVLPARAVYLLTDHVGVPFVQDGWRDGEHVRAEMTGWFVEELVASGQSWALLTGSLEDRLELAVRITDAALDRAAIFWSPTAADTSAQVS